MDIIKIYVDEEDDERLDIYLTQELQNVSRTYIQNLIKEGLVLVNGKKNKPRYLVKEGDYIYVNLPKPEDIEIKPEKIDLQIIYEDKDILIINKEEGMVVHPAPGNATGTLVNALLHYTDQLSSVNGIIRRGIVHRLDKDTTGLIIIAKNDQAHNKLAEDFKERKVRREYLALVHGNIQNPKGIIHGPIGRNPRDRKKMAVVDTNGKEAITYYEVLEYYEKYSLVKANLETGRTHQIRVHLAYINHPIVGDSLYNKMKNPFNQSTQMLHARALGFHHPITGDCMNFEVSPPENFIKILNSLRKL